MPWFFIDSASISVEAGYASKPYLDGLIKLAFTYTTHGSLTASSWAARLHLSSGIMSCDELCLTLTGDAWEQRLTETYLGEQ